MAPLRVTDFAAAARSERSALLLGVNAKEPVDEEGVLESMVVLKAPQVALADLVLDMHRPQGGLGGGAPQPPEATVVNS